jgi:hypothetical protein
MDPDQFQAFKTITQEHEATKRAFEAVLTLTEAVKSIHLGKHQFLLCY